MKKNNNLKIIKKLTINANKTIYQALKKFEENKQGILFIVDSNGRLLGSLTDGDVRRALLKKKNLGLSVRIVMNPSPKTIAVENFMTEILDKFIYENYYKYIPIVDKDNHIIDIFSIDSFNFQKEMEKKYDNKKILVVGGAGFIGSVLIRLLLINGYKVRVFDSLLYGDLSLKDVLTNKNFELVVGDTRNKHLLIGVMKDIDIVVHLGERVGENACSLDEDYTLSVNLTGTQNLIEASLKSMVSRFIYASSCSVYGFGKEIFNEKSQPNPISLYAKIKLECEKMLLSASTREFHPTILRFATGFGLSFRPRFDLVLNKFCLQAFFDKKISVFGGNQWRPLVHVKDMGRAILKLIRSPIEEIDKEIFNIGGNNLNIDLLSLAQIVAKEIPRTKVETQTKKTDSRSYKVDFKKAEEKISFHPQYDFYYGIHELLSFMKQKSAKKNVLASFSNFHLLYPLAENE